jgi:hypothetical protein
MAAILNVFGDAKDGWGLAFWFAGLNSFLDDERPQDVLATDPELVIAAAKDEMAEFAHGSNQRFANRPLEDRTHHLGFGRDDVSRA